MIGASGLVGGALVRVLERHGVPVTAAYRSRPVPGGPEVDVRDRVAVERACASVAPDVVFWAVVAPGGEAHALEVGGVTYVAEACARAGARLVYYSSDYVSRSSRRSRPPTSRRAKKISCDSALESPVAVGPPRDPAGAPSLPSPG